MAETESTHEVAEATKQDGSVVRRETRIVDGKIEENSRVEQDGQAKQVQPDGR